MKDKISQIFFPNKPPENIILWRGEVLGVAKNRIMTIVIIFLILFVLTIFKLLHINLLNPKAESNKYANQIIKRGKILDRNGEVLATNLNTSSLLINHKNILDIDETIKALKTLFPPAKYPKIHYDKLRTEYEEKPTEGWTHITDRLTPTDEQNILNLGMPGLEFAPSWERIYPQANSAAHFVGYVNRDNIGALGMERQLDARLKQGEDIKITMDVWVQGVLHYEVSKAIEKYKAIGGGGLVLNAKTGEVVAMVSLPDFNPNNYGSYPIEVFFNKTTQSAFELGSTMKLFNSAIALDAGAVQMGEKFDATKPLQLGRFTIHDYHAKKSWLTFEEIFIYSSNIGSGRIALKYGAETQKNYMQKLNFLQKMQMDFPENNFPLYPKTWNDLATITASFGHGISISPLQLTAAAIPTITDGILRTPIFTMPKDGEKMIITEKQILKPETINNVRKLMLLNGLIGSGKSSGVANNEYREYYVGGKTGTAEKAVNGAYNKNLMISSYIAGFPIYDPQFVVYAFLDEPKAVFGRPTGGLVAAPIVGEVIKKISKRLNVKYLQPGDAAKYLVDSTLQIDPDAVELDGKHD